jgi:phosphatidylserine/phosphatidylglycerophosphate/cardiolipin synthase-like enzyme
MARREQNGQRGQNGKREQNGKASMTRRFGSLFLLLALGLVALLATQRESVSRAPQTASVRLLYTPSPEALAADADLFAGAKHKIDMAAYVLTDRETMGALIAAARRGVKVRVYMDKSFTARGNAKISDIFDELGRTQGVELRFKAREAGMMHLKSYAVDDRFLRTGSANFSYSGGRYQDNDVLIIDSPAHVAAFTSQFEAMWRRSDNERASQ